MDGPAIGRREALAILGAAGAALAAGCGSNATSPSSASTGTTINAVGTSSSACAVSPTETIGLPRLVSGRATHIHIEVVRNGQSLKVAQIAFPESVNTTVYATGVYASRGHNPLSNTADGIFTVSINSELATVTGDPASSLTATYRVAIAV